MKNRVSVSYYCRTLIFVSMISCAAIFSLFFSAHAFAAAVGCRHDPIVILSNGKVVTITVDMSADAPIVKGIEYKLFVPKGVTVTNITYPGANPLILEKVELHPDLLNGQYRTETKVDAPKSVAVKASTLIQGQSQNVSGLGGDTLKASITLTTP